MMRKGDIMNLSRCDKGHFYDKEKYATCPHCAGGGASDESLTSVFTEDAGMAPQPQAVAPAPVPMAPPIAPEPVPMASAPSPFDNGLPIAGVSADQPTVAMDYNNDTATVPLDQVFGGGVMENQQVDVADDDDDHTVAFFDDVFSNAAASTSTASAPAPAAASRPAAPAPSVNKVSTPCVGWLIAIGGNHIGTDFRLKVGKNFVGRSQQMDVALTEDKSVSRDRHAIVVYEPKQHLYLIQPGESSSLVYRNNEVVLSPVKLEAYDMITVGEVNLLFIPLCGERFNWSNLFEQMEKKN
jgi:hypothetical protein